MLGNSWVPKNFRATITRSDMPSALDLDKLILTQNFGLTYHLGVLISLGIPAFYAVKSVILRVYEGKVEVLLLRYVNTQQTNKKTKRNCVNAQQTNKNTKEIV